MTIAIDTIEHLCIGNVKSIGKESIDFLHFDANGEWYEFEITYDDISTICQDRYVKTFSKYVH